MAKKFTELNWDDKFLKFVTNEIRKKVPLIMIVQLFYQLCNKNYF